MLNKLLCLRRRLQKSKSMAIGSGLDSNIHSLKKLEFYKNINKIVIQLQELLKERPM
jgi:hypothetical protein